MSRKAATKVTTTAPRCEGYRRYGGVFTFGPVRWEQCNENATVMLTVVQDGKKETLPACPTCWNECIENKMKIIAATPIVSK
jgi:hypothetical protein